MYVDFNSFDLTDPIGLQFHPFAGRFALDFQLGSDNQEAVRAIHLARILHLLSWPPTGETRNHQQSGFLGSFERYAWYARLCRRSLRDTPGYHGGESFSHQVG